MAGTSGVPLSLVTNSPKKAEKPRRVGLPQRIAVGNSKTPGKQETPADGQSTKNENGEDCVVM